MTEDAAHSNDGDGDTAVDVDTGDAGNRSSDRVLGLVCLIIGVWYTIEARSFETTAFGSGPVGPKTMPTGVGLIFLALAAYLIVRPDRSPSWPSMSFPHGATWRIALVLGCSYLYGQVIDRVGFIVASAAMVAVIGTLFRAPARVLAPAAVIFPVVLAFLFNNLLELQLPAGWWGGF